MLDTAEAELPVVYKTFCAVNIVLGLFSIYSILRSESQRQILYLVPLCLIAIVSQVILLPWSYFNPVIHCISGLLLPVMMLIINFRNLSILELYKALDTRIKSLVLLRLKYCFAVLFCLAFVTLSVTYATLLPAINVTSQFFDGLFGLVTILYDSIQSVYLGVLVYRYKVVKLKNGKQVGASETETKAATMSLQRLTFISAAINLLDCVALGIYLYNGIVLPAEVSIFPFCVNIAALHCIAVIHMFRELKNLTFAGQRVLAAEKPKRTFSLMGHTWALQRPSTGSKNTS
ncbi:hypothetical protein HDU91_006047 [Kappamyces sp. JEL0680]|nr:hypothetical protein HDU91_006047 [Kappamyces sp. JEL0680]